MEISEISVKELEELLCRSEDDLENLKNSRWRGLLPGADFEFLLQERRFAIRTLNRVIGEIRK